MPDAPAITREHVVRQQRAALAERLFDLEADVALLQQEVARRDQRIAELQALIDER